MNVAYIVEQITSFSLDDIILKIFYLVISLIFRTVLVKIYNRVKLFIKSKVVASKLSDKEKLFIKNISFNPDFDVGDIDNQFNSLKDRDLFTFEFAETETVSLGGEYISTGKNKNKITLKLTPLGKRVVSNINS